MSGCGKKFAILGIILLVVSLCSCQNSNATVGETTTEHPQIQLLKRWRVTTNDSVDAKKKERPELTGIPQIDYAHDPNLPHELHGYDLSDYPFYNRVPNIKFNFSCDDRHDGFYASIPHKCQVYHNCLFGVRYDFLCANYTAFDQSNFICHWANSVDCDNSELYYDRNNELYVEATTTTTTTAAPVVKIVYVDRQTGNVRKGPGGNRVAPNKKKPTTKPEPEVIYDDAVYDDYAYDVKPQESSKNTKKPIANDYVYDDAIYYDDVTEATTTTTTTQKPQVKRRPNRPLKTRTGDLQSTNSRQEQRTSVKVQPNQQLPDYDFEDAPTGGRQTQRTQQDGQRGKPLLRRRKKTTTTTTTTATPEYYDDYYYYDTESAPVTEASKKRPVLPGSRPTAEDRRKALLTSRVSHLVPKSIPPVKSEQEELVAEELVAEEPVAEEQTRNKHPSPAEPQRNARPSIAERVVEEPSRNTRPRPAEPVVEEAPRLTRPSAKTRTQNPVPAPPETDSFRSASYDDYEYEILPPAEAVKEPEVEPVPFNSRRRGTSKFRRTPSQTDRARARRNVISK